jgi:hypothetical protein
MTTSLPLAMLKNVRYVYSFLTYFC